MAVRQYNGGASGIAIVGVITALSVSCLYLSAISPVARLGITAVAGLFPAGAVISGGLKSGFFCYGATGVLGLLLLPEKGNMILYLLFFGIWPMLKSLFERLPNRGLEWVCKLATCNGLLALLWFGLRSVLLPVLPAGLQQTWMVVVAGNIAFIVYDLGFSKLIAFYMMRIDRVLRKST